MQNHQNSIQSAIGDIAVIRQTLERSKYNLGRLSSLFLWYGGIMLLVNIFQSACRIFLVRSEMYTAVSAVYYLKHIVLAILFVFFVKTRKSLKINNNVYTLQLFDIWGVVLFFFPLGHFLIMGVQLLVAKQSFITNLALFSYSAAEIIEYASVGIVLLMTGFILNNRVMKIVALLVLALYPISYFFGIPTIDQSDSLSAYGYIYEKNTYLYIANLLIYIAFGIYFKIRNKKCGGDNSGTE